MGLVHLVRGRGGPVEDGGGHVHAERELDDARAAYALADRWIADLVRDARFAVGDRVTHAAFGSGRVLAVDSQKRAYEVAFDDLDTPRTISFKAKLEQA